MTGDASAAAGTCRTLQHVGPVDAGGGNADQHLIVRRHRQWALRDLHGGCTAGAVIDVVHGGRKRERGGRRGHCGVGTTG